MLEEEMTSQIIDKKAYKTEIAKKYTTFLAKYPEIFSDLVNGSDFDFCLLYTSPSPRDGLLSRMPSSA